MTRIYTKTGDDGQTGLFGGGRVSKAHLRVEAYGAVDELNSVIGWVITQLAAVATQLPAAAVATDLERVQSDLFTIGAHLATPAATRGRRPQLPELAPQRITDLESWIDRLEADLPELRSFILPGGSPAGAALHLARTVCRRAERRVVALAEREELETAAIVYLNRLSDLLFVLARQVNQQQGALERPWPAS